MTLEPFYWGGCQFLLSGELQPELEGELVKWYEHWIDSEDERVDASADFRGVIHSASMSTSDHGSWSLEIDFGSAPTAAFMELVQLIGRLCKGQVLINSDFPDDSQDQVN